MAAPRVHSEVGLKERFFRYFQHEVTALQEQIQRLNSMSVAGGERNDAVDHCLAGIDRLSHEVKDASSYIPAYDQRTYSEAIKALSEKLQNTRNTFNPPKKFAFKTRKNASAISISDAAELAQSQNLRAPVYKSDTSNANSSFAPTPLDRLSPGEQKTQQEALGNIEENGSDGLEDNTGLQRPLFPNASKVTISNHDNIHVVLPAEASHATSSGTLSDLTQSVIDLSPATQVSPFSALYLKDIKDSLIICGQVAGAIHITNVQKTVLVISCRQFRMHGSKNVDVYLHSSSRPIIEDCEMVRFAPMPAALQTSENAQAANQWDQIDDFKWLKTEPSPNFSILDESQRARSGAWLEKVGGGDGGDLNEILTTVGDSLAH
ncbi:tubulin-specific chaperone-like protein c [Paraphoma chrysanthemicola]|uniref:Tubulin-specific chaperone-like protein c n=1 Tax=Paraphoma chrysanthemicola TaxID=798071 RepID=A0A8K0RHI7_9PLEO|nr:tubulin-specific chaperone-like protein c [Paraphoma chrysanthemicola]